MLCSSTLVLIIIGLTTLLAVQAVKLVIANRKIKFYESAMKNLPVGLYMKDLHGNIIFSNEQMIKMTGNKGSPENFKHVNEIFSKDHIHAIDEGNNAILTTRKPLTFEKVYLPSNGIPHHYRMIKSPIFDNYKNIKGFLVIFKNIDKEIFYEKRKDCFIATLTHDLKTPTNAQLKMLNLLLNGTFGHLTEEQHEMLNLTKCSCKYMADLVATIVDTYKYDCGNLKLNHETFDIIFLINRLTKGLKHIADDRSQRIIFESNMDSCFVYADRLQIKRVILNLLSNAVNYGYEKTSIIINFTCHNGKIDFSVTNESFPIPQNQLKHIFNKFCHTDNSKYNKASTSLGLYLSKQIIDMHKGKIYAQSNDQGICTFGFKMDTKIETLAMAQPHT